ncbi:uncharacterized protein PADG_11305 [Paracoccidioides brasiliensis Pb18]|uniref:Uncharacterized protein n=1 Tax=Paracoccidioides brasiliensis (strain Pb18) TaxID=502780 RepID=A0A0A0HVR4_PARBD|nr:uncharacterized protein PADG_11305 [Paracoccidioides brasiliensis Pb18]KGM92483.1 hypothetical protein PADG_11305 [Paracoccidioides brasiliensis Pb18]
MSPRSSLDGIGEALEISSRNPLSTSLGNGDDAIQTSQRLSGSGSTVYSNSNVEDHKRHIGGDMGRGAGNAMYMPQGAMTKLLEVVKLP